MFLNVHTYTCKICVYLRILYGNIEIVGFFFIQIFRYDDAAAAVAIYDDMISYLVIAKISFVGGRKEFTLVYYSK